MKMIVTPKTKKQEKAVKELLSKLDVDFTIAEEDAAVYKTKANKPLKKVKQDSTEVPVTIPAWQKKEVLKRIKKYEKHPELLIDEQTALTMINRM